MGEVDATFGHSDKVAGLEGGDADFEGSAICHADIFAGEAGDSAGDVEWIFTCFEHTGKPIDGGLHIAITHGFVKGGDDIIVFLAVFIV